WSLTQALVDFSHNRTEGGLLVARADDPGSRRLAVAARAEGIRVRTYGQSAEADVRIAVEESTPTFIRARLHGEGEFPLVLRVPGVDNLLDSAGAWCAGGDLGVCAASLAAAPAQIARRH